MNNPYALSNIKVDPIINGYSIGKLDCGAGWYALKVGENRGHSFKTKKAAISWIEKQN